MVLRYNQCVGPDAPQGSKAVKDETASELRNFIFRTTSFSHAEPDVRARQLICTTLLPFYKEHVMHQHLQKVTSNSKRQKIKMNSSQSVLGCVSGWRLNLPSVSGHLHWVPYLLFLSGIL